MALTYALVWGAQAAARRGWARERGVSRGMWATVGDNDVCIFCDALNGTDYDVNQALPELPAHINCRCRWVPKYLPQVI